MSSEEKKNQETKNIDSKQEQKSVKSQDKESNLSKLEKDLDIDELPQEAQAIVRMMMSRSISTSSLSPLQDKINPEHISKILDIAEEDNKREFEDIKLVRIYNLLTLIIVLIFLGFLTVFLANKDLSTYQDIIRILIIFGGGFGAGFGYKSRIK
ncbi:MAG: hypothetical protein ACRC8K_26935 [Waterburya sp.]